MTKSSKKLATNDSEIDREFKSLMADHKRVIRKIERMVDEQAKKHGISFVKEK